MPLTRHTTNWSGFLDRLRHRFPHVDPDLLADPVQDPAELTRHLAQQHDLTLLEASEELRDFLGLEDLARQACELRAG
ncbi:hypothetical protein [Tropicibacter oceani]|uniref:Uncharacterized protein n=1 Tax=Tropicibacter oceani TaxID=3058420 RepID=A0ABY8QE76_9RHOB|nr:hypothetical protein [Tropicibacter oceani]WGW02895.1 hypothetical protein QF118_13230 [Tropicibacter oceani]